VKPPPQCPRCASVVRAPGLMSSDWVCEVHGAVHPYHGPTLPSDGAMRRVIDAAEVPVWLPWPLPAGWLVTGAADAGDERTGGRATVVACSGPAPFGGVGELVLVAEELGVGLGARFAGLPGPDPGEGFAVQAPGARVDAVGWPTPLWSVVEDPDLARDRAVWVGEAAGAWLWVVVWPETADLLLHDGLSLVDLRDPAFSLDLPFGALSPRLAA
jgi:hypothetical protein